jgi:hypothetical protein
MFAVVALATALAVCRWWHAAAYPQPLFCTLGGTSNTVPDGGCPNEVRYRHLTGTFQSLMR